ncbi:MAG: FmdB family zinc ribbon protein [Gemmataceae bacterium]|jgi:putative FmdB family regulatory protein
MPLYEFACKSCQNEFEILVFPGEIAKCPSCEGKKLEKKWSLPGSIKVENGSPCDISGPPCNPKCCKIPQS